MPPPAEGLASRLLLAPALRTQPDRRLVTLVRQGYEAAFEEIVRRYGRPLTRYAASIVGGRSDDVTQDAFSKALLALRRDDAEIELRPWLFRIVRNTALNELRDSPPSPEALAEALIGGDGDPAEELERREELADLMRRLRALPESQRAAIVMRELEGLGHEEIAAALGLTDGGARQAIYRARQTLRDGLGMLVPLPLMQSLLAATSTPGATEAAAGAVGVGGVAGAGVGAGIALKATAATVLVAGAVGAGVALEPDAGNGEAGAAPVHASRGPAGGETADVVLGSRENDASGREERQRADHGSGSSHERSRHGEAEPADDHGGGGRAGDHGESPGQDDRLDGSGDGSGSGSGSEGLSSGSEGSGSGSGSGSSGSGPGSGESGSGRGGSGLDEGTSSGSGSGSGGDDDSGGGAQLDGYRGDSHDGGGLSG